MIIVSLLIALAVWGIAWTIIDVRRDGYRPRDTDWTRVADRDDDALRRAESATTYR
ncbi:MAG TPA: hypothetical protein VN035_08940 [Microbacterium sp.]|nr:hypothetical protein [Microbacterium sp.]